MDLLTMISMKSLVGTRKSPYIPRVSKGAQGPPLFLCMLTFPTGIGSLAGPNLEFGHLVLSRGIRTLNLHLHMFLPPSPGVQA